MGCAACQESLHCVEMRWLSETSGTGECSIEEPVWGLQQQLVKLLAGLVQHLLGFAELKDHQRGQYRVRR